MTGLVPFIENELGLTLWPKQRQLASEYDAERPQLAAWRLGRRSGKTTLAAAVAIHDAVAEHYAAFVRPGEVRYCLVVSVAERSAQLATMAAVKSLVRGSRSVQRLVVAETESELMFSTGCAVRVLPNNARSTRGLPATTIILDELAHFVDSEGFQSGVEVLRALGPSIAQFATHGRILATSTPNGRSGAFFELCQRGREWVAPAWEMNPTLDAGYLEQQRQLDPDAFAVEFGAEWGAGVAAFLSPDSIEACVVRGQREHPPRPRATYTLSLDPAFTGDAFGAAVACREGEMVYCDAVRSWRGTRKEPVLLGAVLAEVGALAERYNQAGILSDQFAAQPLIQAAADRGLQIVYQPWTAETKLNLFTELKHRINTRSIALPDVPELLAELRSLEIRRGAVRPRIAAAGSGHDDLATSLAGALGERKRKAIRAA